MKHISFLEKEKAYAASITDTEIYLPKNLEELSLSFQGDMTAGTAKTVTNLLAAIAPFELKVSATPRIRLTGDELLAFNRLYLGHRPVTQVAGATTNDKTRVLGLKIPMNYPSGGPPLHYNSTYAAASGIDTMLFSLRAEYQDAPLADGPLHVLPINYTAAASATMLKAAELVLKGDLLGLLLYVTTPPVDDSDNCGIAELELFVDGVSEIRSTWWDLYHQPNFVDDIDGTATVALFDNWGLLDLRKDPILAGKPIRIDTLDDVAEAVKIIPIQRVPAGPI